MWKVSDTMRRSTTDEHSKPLVPFHYRQEQYQYRYLKLHFVSLTKCERKISSTDLTATGTTFTFTR